jgi:hypothetical protein
MFIIPYRVDQDHYSLFIVLQRENIARITEYDPATVEPSKMGSEWSRLKLMDIFIGYATDEDVALIRNQLRHETGLTRTATVQQVLNHLSRGFRYRPDPGDNDEPYKSSLGEAT